VDASDLVRLFEYDRWANRAAWGSIEATAEVPVRVSALMAHIIGAEWLWWARLQGSAPRLAVWPELSTAQCAAELEVLAGTWADYVGGLTSEGLGSAVRYTNSRGERWTSAVGDVLLHVMLHSAYHRGQIASAVRAAGGEPAYTDFIHGVRSGAVRGWSN
jgi:uncharacterized damage-inducible protein DinB